MSSTRAGFRGRGCAALTMWLRGRITSLCSSLLPGASSGSSGQEFDAIDRDRLEALYTAALNVDFATVQEVCGQFQSATRREAAIRHVVLRIEKGWQDDTIGIIQTSDAFWTIKRAMAFLRTETSRPTGSIPEIEKRAVVCVPPEEEHTFGAQLLFDQLREIGVNSQLSLREKRSDLYERLESEKIDILAISVGYDRSLLELPELIQEARIVSANPQMTIALGGQVFVAPPQSYAFLQADLVLNPDADPIDQLVGAVEKNSMARGLQT